MEEDEYDSDEDVELKRKRNEYILDEVEEEDIDEDADDYAGVDVKEREELKRMREYYEKTSHKQKYRDKLDIMEERFKHEDVAAKREVYEEAEEDYYDEQDEPKGAYMPSVQDPKLWLLKCGKNTEREIAMALLLKYFDLYDTDGRLMISSVVISDKLVGYVYIEARKEQYVIDAVKDLQKVYKKKPFLVPLNDMVSIMRIDEAKMIDIKPDQWVRITRGLYKNDLAQIHQIEEHQTKVVVKVMPRIDSNIDLDDDENENKVRKHFSTNKPPQRPFNKSEYEYETVKYMGDDYVLYKGKRFRNGLLYKQVNVKAIGIHSINPTNEEIKMYSMLKDDDGKELYSFDEILSSIKDVKKHIYQQHERIEVVIGDLKGLIGIVQSCKPDGSSVVVKPTNAADFDASIEVECAWVTKKFHVGDNVTILDGMHRGMAGIVMHVDQYLVEVLSHDLTKRVKARGVNLMLGHSKAQVNYDYRNNLSNKYSIHDLVAFKSKEDANKNDNGVVIQVEKNYLRLLLNENLIENIPYNMIIQKISNQNKYAATDRNTNSLNVGDTVKIYDGFYRGQSGSIKHIFKNIAWINCPDQIDNLGYIALNSKRLIKSGYGAIKGYVQNSTITRSKSNESKYIIIKNGPFKGHKAYIKKIISGNKFVVELTSKAKITTLDESDFKRVDANEEFASSGGANMHPGSLKTPAYVPGTANSINSPGGGFNTPSGDNPFRNNISNPNSPSRSLHYDQRSNSKFTPNTDQPYNFSPSREKRE